MANQQISPRDAFEYIAQTTRLVPVSLPEHEKIQALLSILRQTFFAQPVNLKPKDREPGKIIDMEVKKDGETDKTNDGR